MQRATRQDGPGRPGTGRAGGRRLAPAPARGRLAACLLPPPRPLAAADARHAAARGAAASGASTRARRWPPTALATALAAACGGGRATRSPRPAGRLVGLYVYVNHVDGLAPGTYRLRRRAGCGCSTRRPPGGFLQDNYFLANYNLERPARSSCRRCARSAVLDAVGDRGYRLVNAAIGAVAQNVYVAAAALGLGCGVALGFDNVSYVEQLGLTDGEAPLLLMMLGADRPGSADFRYEIA